MTQPPVPPTRPAVRMGDSLPSLWSILAWLAFIGALVIAVVCGFLYLHYGNPEDAFLALAALIILRDPR